MIQLPNLRPGEKIEIVLRRHRILYLIMGVYFFLGLFLTWVIWGLFWLNPYINLLLIAFWMGFSLFLFIDWLDHELDMFVVTNNRIIWVEQIAFLNRIVSECNLGQVQEVNSSTIGFFANILNYGTVTIRTAGGDSSFSMMLCPDAQESARKVLNVVDDYRDHNGIVSSLDGGWYGKWPRTDITDEGVWKT